MMKVLIISNIDSFGGTRTYLKNLLNYYQDRKFEITVASETYANVNDLVRNQKLKNTKVLNLGRRPSWISRINPYVSLPTIFYEAALLNKLVDNVSPNLLVVTPVEGGCFLTAMFLKASKVLVIHSYPRAKLSLAYRLLSVYSHNNTFLTVSKFSLSAIRKYWKSIVDESNSLYIYNPLEMNVKKEKYCQRILTIGHLESYKDPATWIKTVAQLVTINPKIKYKFTWVGDGSKREWLQDNICKLALQNYCEILSPVNDVSKLYSVTYLYFQPSIAESQGISVGNAQYLGIPAVVSSAGGLPEMVKDNITGNVVLVGDYRNMALAINRIIKSKSIYNKYSLAAKARTNETFSLHNWTNQMELLHSSR